MAQKEKARGIIAHFPPLPVSKKSKVFAFLLALFLVFAGGAYAQSDFPAGDFWSLDAGGGISNLLVEGTAFQLIVDPKLWLSPLLMVGTKLGVNYSTDEILTFEGQAYLRWNFLRLGKNPERLVNIFAQGGIGMIAAYRGDSNPFDNVERTRGSLMFDGALGVTIPLSPRWHIEPLVRGGYPHIFGATLTVGYKFPLPQKETRVTRYVEQPRVEYREVIRQLPPAEIVKSLVVNSVEYILFGPDIGTYNIGVDEDARSLNELVLTQAVRLLREHPDYIVRIEGHANPVTADPAEADELMTLSTVRANGIAGQLKERGVPENQMVTVAFGGTRTVTSEHDIWNRNRRVELVIIQIDASGN